MRTCPTCGEDTEASYSEPCTECGASPFGEQPEATAPEPDARFDEPPAPEADATFGEPTEPPPPTEPPLTEPPPAEPTAEKKKRSPVRLVFWLVIIAGFFGLYQYGVFDEATGPTAEEVEESIEANAPAGTTVDCPDDADETPVEGTFTCTATLRNGRTLEIVVTNHEDTFEWESLSLRSFT